MKLQYFAYSLFVLTLTACSGSSKSTDNVVADTVAEGNTEIALDSTVNGGSDVVDIAGGDAADVVKVFDNDSKAEANGKPLVIDFSATWCGPCQQFKPTFHKVAAEYAAKADFASADVDICTTLAQKYNIQSIPYVLIIRQDGKTVHVEGKMTEEEFKSFLDKNL